MESNRWQQINDLLDAVLDRESEDRAGILTQGCAGNQTLRREVESLLVAHEQAGSFMEASPAESVDGLFDNSRSVVGETIGPYRVLSELGRGGMGVVYLAARADQSYSRLVAIKLVRPGPNHKEVLKRFQQERQILARLDHFNISRLLDGGTTEGGIPYVVMEYVAGIPITDYCDDRKLSITERLNLFRTACSAVHFAHQNLIIHRDLKPTNILVTDGGTVKLLDFGIAKLLKPDLYAQSLDLTHTGLHLMTPRYASPEQVRGTPVTTASDVYSLGVILYELLTGHPPYRLRTHALPDLEAIICDMEPEKPSVIINRVDLVDCADKTTHARRTPENVSRPREGRPEKLRARLSGDLDNIVLMALRKDARQRYQSVEQFSEDIRRHLEGNAVIARKITLSYRAGKFIRRHRVGVMIAVLFVLTLIGGIIATTHQMRVAERLARNNRWLLYAAHMNLAGQAWDSVNLERVQELVDMNRPRPGEEDLRGFEWYYLWRLCHDSSEYMTLRHADDVWSVTFSPDGKRIASGSEDARAIVWDAGTGLELLSLAGHKERVYAVAFSRDGKRLATAGGDETAIVWDASTGEKLAQFIGHTARVNAAVFSPDGRRLFTGSDDRTIRVWDVAGGKQVAAFNVQDTMIRTLALSPDGRMLVTAGLGTTTAKLWSAATGKHLRTLDGHSNAINLAKFSRDGQVLATASYDSTVKLWNVSEGRELVTLRGHNSRANGLDFSPDGRKIATCSDDRTIRVWDVSTGQESACLRGHMRPIESVAFFPDGSRLASASLDETVKLWDLADCQVPAAIPRVVDKSVLNMSYLQEGKIKTTDYGGGIFLWDGADVKKFLHSEGILVRIAASPDGRSIAIGDGTGPLRVYEVWSSKSWTALEGCPNVVNSITYSPDGKMLAAAGQDGTLKVWDAATNQQIISIRAQEGRVFTVAFSPDSRTLATGGDYGEIKLWDVASGREIAALRGHTDWVHSVAFSPDGRRLASGSYDTTMRLWDIPSGRSLVTFKGHVGGIRSVAFSHDGKRLATGACDYTVRIWDVATGQELICLKGHKDQVVSVAFSLDDQTLVSGSRDGVIMLWRAATGEEVEAQSGE